MPQKPSILLINRVYPPQSGATGQLLAELAKALVGQGWGVTVVTSREDKLPTSSLQDGVRVERVMAPNFGRKGFARRALSYTALYPALFWRTLRLPAPDIIVTMTDPPLLAVLGSFLSIFKGSALLHWAQDIYPELAEELGVLARRGLAARALREISTRAIRKHHAIVAVGRCMEQRLLQRGISPDRIHCVPNWSPALAPSTGKAFREVHQLQNKFVAMYSGNLGLAHSFGPILEAAGLLQISHPQVCFVFVGDGPQLPRLLAQVDARALSNVRFLPRQSLESLGSTLASAEVHLVTMQTNLAGLVVPSKVYGVLAAGKPCLFLGPAQSEAARLLSDTETGCVVSEENGKEVARIVAEWSHNSVQFKSLQQNARAIAGQFGVDSAVSAFIPILKGLVQRDAEDAEVVSTFEHQQSPTSTAI